MNKSDEILEVVRNAIRKYEYDVDELDELIVGYGKAMVNESKEKPVDTKHCVDCGKYLGNAKFHAEGGKYRCYSCYEEAR